MGTHGITRNVVRSGQGALIRPQQAELTPNDHSPAAQEQGQGAGCLSICGAPQCQGAYARAPAQLARRSAYDPLLFDDCLRRVSRGSVPLVAAPQQLVDAWLQNAIILGGQTSDEVSGTIANGTLSLTLAAASGVRKLVAGVIVEITANETVNLGTLQITIAAEELQSGEAYSSGAIKVKLLKYGSGIFVVLFTQPTVSGAPEAYPALAWLDNASTLITVAANAFGAGVPANPTNLARGANRRITAAVVGQNNTGVRMAALTPADSLWDTVVSHVLGE